MTLDGRENIAINDIANICSTESSARIWLYKYMQHCTRPDWSTYTVSRLVCGGGAVLGKLR